MRKATTFEDYKALVHSTTDDKKSGAKKHATHNAYNHDLDVYNPVGYPYKGYDLDTDIDTLYANAANTHEGMISSSNHFHQMTLEGCKIWIALPPKDCKLILEPQKRDADTNRKGSQE